MKGAADARPALAALKRLSGRKDRANLTRFGITARNALGVSMANIQKVAKSLGRSHDLAAALWTTGVYEARLLAAYVDEPERVTPAQMEKWCRDFDNWAVCDTLCFALFDRTPHAWSKVAPWSRRRREFEKRAAFALIACLALHDKRAADERFEEFLPLIEHAALDDRNFVKKGVSWALRAIGLRNAGLRSAALDIAGRLATAPEAAARWIGRDALKALSPRKK
jgi:3-methyladenine DNA glycosylase AlkD